MAGHDLHAPRPALEPEDSALLTLARVNGFLALEQVEEEVLSAAASSNSGESARIRWIDGLSGARQSIAARFGHGRGRGASSCAAALADNLAGHQSSW
jgi:hypothetical protein